MSLLMPAMMFGMNLLSVLIVWVGGHAIAQSTLQIGDMMAFYPVRHADYHGFPDAGHDFHLGCLGPACPPGAFWRCWTRPCPSRTPEKPEVLEEPKGVVEFQDVSFRYHNADGDVLEHHLLYRQARGDHGLYRRHRRGQIHLGEPDSPVLRHDRGRRHH